MAKSIALIDIAVPRATILDKEHQELYKEVFVKTAEKFGEDSPACKKITNGISATNVTGSQFFWNTNLQQYLPSGQRIINLSDIETINSIDETFLKGIYSDTRQVVLRSNKPSWNQNKYILENLVKQVDKDHSYSFSAENPLVISNLELIQDNNPQNKYGLLLKIGEGTTIQNDERFAHSNNQSRIQFGQKTKTVWTKENGLSRLYVYDDDLYSRYDNLANSGDNGRVVVVDTEGVNSIKLEKYKTKIQERTKKQIAKIQKRVKGAIHYIETGKLE